MLDAQKLRGCAGGEGVHRGRWMHRGGGGAGGEGVHRVRGVDESESMALSVTQRDEVWVAWERTLPYRSKEIKTYFSLRAGSQTTCLGVTENTRRGG